MDHAATVRRFYDLINAGDLDGFGALLAGDFIEHEETPGLAPTKEGVLTFSGTNRGDFMGMKATGKGVSVELIDIMLMGDDGLCHEHWGVLDLMTMMQQLGVVPAGPPA